MVVRYDNEGVDGDEDCETQSQPEVRVQRLPERLADAVDHAHNDVLEVSNKVDRGVLIALVVVVLVVRVNNKRVIEVLLPPHIEEHEGLEASLDYC